MPDRQTRISLPKPMLDRLVAAWLPRALHPGAWWIWALGLAAAATRTTNPILLLLIIAVASVVVMARRPDTPWARSFRIYLMLGLVVVVFRVVFRMLFGGFGPTVLFTLPSIQLPEIMAGVHLLGAVSAEALLGAFYDGLRLATMIICVGAANSLANPKRLLASRAAGAVRDRHRARRQRVGVPATGGIHHQGQTCQGPPRRSPAGTESVARHRYSGAGRRIGPIVAARGGDGFPGLRPSGRGAATAATADLNPADRGRHRALHRRLRNPGRHHAALPRPADDDRRRAGRGGGLPDGRPAGAPHPVPAGPLAGAGAVRRRLRCAWPGPRSG